MAEKKLKIACMGLNNKALELLESASDIEYFDIKALADRNTDLAEKIGQKYQCNFYDDYRQLIIQNQLDLLIVAAPLHTCAEYLQAAMKKKVNILKLPPMAPNFEDAAELIHLAQTEKIEFVIANTFRFASSFLQLQEYLNESYIENIHLITAVFSSSPANDQQNWNSDPKLAGGGVLLNSCYQLIDQLVLNFSMPQQVYSLTTNWAPDKKQRLYLTEDTAIVTMKFTDSLITNLTASRNFGPDRQILKIYGKDKNLTVTPDSFSINDSLGQPIEHFDYNENNQALAKRLLENLAEHLLFSGKRNLAGTPEENLNNMALIDSAYLSANTAMPEEPARILQLVKT